MQTHDPHLMTADRAVTEEQDWGRLVWMVSGRQGNSTELTVGRCYIAPGQENPRHYHPNCDEVLHVLQGRILHSVDDATFEMGPGDTVSIPSGRLHNARNIGTEEAIFVISFNNADRQTVGE
jgi:quercetin dioxygenase-like cupin family protein